MAELFIDILNLSISASLLVLAVVVLRAFLARKSRRAACLLWIVVAVRLLVPFSFETGFGLIPENGFVSMPGEWKEVSFAEAQDDKGIAAQDDAGIGAQEDRSADGSRVSKSTAAGTRDFGSTAGDSLSWTLLKEDAAARDNDGQGKEGSIAGDKDENGNGTHDDKAIGTRDDKGIGDQDDNSADASRVSKSGSIGFSVRSFIARGRVHAHRIMGIISIIWLAGAAAILCYAMISFLHLRKITSESARQGDYRLCDRISTPFILGVVHPEVYIPSALSTDSISSVMAHERTHLRRLDHVWKLLGFVLLGIYWFNPMMWLAYALLCKDIEFACDETVIASMNSEQIKEYSETLLACGISSYHTLSCPLAFGEIAVKDRIKAVLNYKKPAFWIIFIALVLCLGLTVVFMSGSGKNDKSGSGNNASDITGITPGNSLPSSGTSGEGEDSISPAPTFAAAEEGSISPSPATDPASNSLNLPVPKEEEIPADYCARLLNEGRLPGGNFILSKCLYHNYVTSYFAEYPGFGHFYGFYEDSMVIGSTEGLIDPDLQTDYTRLKLSGPVWEDFSVPEGWVIGYDEALFERSKFLWYSYNGVGRTYAVLNSGSKLYYAQFAGDGHLYNLYELAPAPTEYLTREGYAELVSDFDASDGHISIYGNDFEINDDTTLLSLFETTHLIDRDHVRFEYHEENEAQVSIPIYCDYSGEDKNDVKNMALRYFKVYLGTFPALRLIDTREADFFGDNRICKLTARPTGEYGYTISLYGRYVILSAVNSSGTVKNILYFKYAEDGFVPDYASIRRIFFQKEQYDLYANICDYNERITKTGLYPSGRGYLMDLDGDGKDERVFITWCGVDYWEEPARSWFGDQRPSNYYYDYGYRSKELIYVNGRLATQFTHGTPSVTDSFIAADIDSSDGSIELVINDSDNIVNDNRVYAFRNGELVRNELSWFMDSEDYCSGDDLNTLKKYFPGDGNMYGRTRLLILSGQFFADCIWKLETDGSLSVVSGLYYPWEALKKDNLGDDLHKLQMELPVMAARDMDPASERSLIEPGLVIPDITDGKHWLHIISEDGVAGWIDTDDLKDYIVDYDSIEREDEYKSDADYLFSNIWHAG